MKTVTYNGNTYTIDMNKVIFSYNVYTENSATGGFGLVDLYGAPRVFFIAETFTGNGDASRETVTNYIGTALMDGTVSSTLAALRTGAASSTTLSAGCIRMKRLAEISMFNMTFDNNWLLETDYTINRA